jgi:hypothetical protein
VTTRPGRAAVVVKVTAPHKAAVFVKITLAFTDALSFDVMAS